MLNYNNHYPDSGGSLTISPTEQQQRQCIQVSQAVIEKIGQVVEAKSKRYGSLNTDADCRAYKNEMQRLIDQIQVANLPVRLVECLQAALKATEVKLAEILEQKKVENCLEQIQRLYNSLSALATQQEYADIQTQFENLVATVPIVKGTDFYKNTIQSLADKQNALFQQAVNWESHFSPAMPRSQAVQLSQDINRQLNRYTSEESKQKLNELLQRLENIILERESGKQQEEMKLQKQQRSAAKSWLEKLEIRNTNLEQLTEPARKLEAASQLLMEIKQERNQHAQMLEVQQKQTLEQIINRCVEIQNQDLESQILIRFQKLPLARRESLLKKLTECLSTPTEEFYG